MPTFVNRPMQNQIPQLEVFPGQYEDNQTPQPAQRNSNWFRLHRLLVFSLVFLISLTLGLIFVFIRPPVYLSSATLLTVAPTALDQISGEADLQHVLIQRQILTGQPLLDKTLTRLISKAEILPEYNSVDEIRPLLNIIPLEETNLVELHAEGENPEFLQALINTLLEVYIQIRSDFIMQTSGTLNAALQEEIRAMEEKIKLKRDESERYRLQHDILSAESDDNRPRARLRGLNDSLNKASEAEVTAKARLDAIQIAIAQGKAVVPQNETRNLAQMQNRAQELRERNAELNRLYTPAYIKLRPELKIVAEQLAQLEAKIAAILSHGKSFMLTEARLEYESAKQSVVKIQQQLDEHKAYAAAFTTAFSKHEALQEELLEMEEIFRETQQRLIELEVKQREKYPQVDVVEWAFLPHVPIRPFYMRDAGIATAVSLVLGLIAVWLAEFLTREETNASPITLSGIHLYKGEQTAALAKHPDNKLIPEEKIKSISQSFPRELSNEEIHTLLESADAQVAQLIMLMLSGVSIEESLTLHSEALDLDRKQLHIKSGNGRTISLSDTLLANIRNNLPFPAWQDSHIETLDDLQALITYTAIDSGVDTPEEINTEAIQHTYIVYLIQQGMRLSELQRIVGPLPLSTIARYGRYSPAGAGITASEIVLEYPLNLTA